MDQRSWELLEESRKLLNEVYEEQMWKVDADSILHNVDPEILATKEGMAVWQQAMRTHKASIFKNWLEIREKRRKEREERKEKMIAEGIIPNRLAAFNNEDGSSAYDKTKVLLERTGLSLKKAGGFGREWEQRDPAWQARRQDESNPKYRNPEAPVYIPTYLFISCPKCSQLFKDEDKLCSNCGQERI